MIPMKKFSLHRPSFNLIVCIACVATSVDVGFAQPPAYASTYYPAPQPTFGDRVRSAGQSVGDFVRRKFYGEPAPGAYPQQPVYHRPPGSGARSGYQARSYNLDAPAQSRAPDTGGTGFQPADRKTTPKYATPPRSEPQPAPVKKVDDPKPKAKTKPTPAPTASKKRNVEPEPVAKKRYAPATPSTFAKSKTTSERKRVEEEPPPPLSTTITAPTPPEPPRYEAPPEPKTEVKLSNQGAGTSNGIDSPSSSVGISPTIGGSDYSFTPPSLEKDETVISKSSQKSSSTTSKTTSETSGTTDVGTKSSGSFLVGKKTSKAGRVISPYAPYNELDITGLPTGSLALDPTTQKVFQVP